MEASFSRPSFARPMPFRRTKSRRPNLSLTRSSTKTSVSLFDLSRRGMRIAPIVRRRLPGTVLGLSLSKATVVITAAVTVQAESPVPAEAVRQLETDLRTNTDPRIRLRVSTQLVASGSA